MNCKPKCMSDVLRWRPVSQPVYSAASSYRPELRAKTQRKLHCLGGVRLTKNILKDIDATY